MDQGTLVQGPEAFGAEAAVILESKLHPPLLHPEHISRPRLLRRLDEGLARRLTLVDAPAGSGKSTLIAEWCASQRMAGRFAWVLLDNQDNDPFTFWTYVIHALRSVWIRAQATIGHVKDRTEREGRHCRARIAV